MYYSCRSPPAAWHVHKVPLVPHSVPGVAMDNDAKVDVSVLYLSAAVHLEVDDREEVDEGWTWAKALRSWRRRVPQRELSICFFRI